MNPYDPQLSVAMRLDIWRQRADAYRAERDQARQEAKGLREELETAEAEYRRHRANLDARYEKKADESRRRGQAMHGMSRLIRERNEEIKALKERIADMEPRLMPEGYEWLRYENGEPVPLGGEVTVTVHDEDGDFDRTFAIRSIKYEEDGVLLEGTKNEMVILSLGERVKRPEADSWERVEADCSKCCIEYCDEHGLLDAACNTAEGDASTRHCTDCGDSCEERMARDLVRRCKALAGGERVTDEAASELSPCPALDRRECTGGDTEYDCHSSRMRAVANRIREALGEGA